jgi:hypothetical protein
LGDTGFNRYAHHSPDPDKTRSAGKLWSTQQGKPQTTTERKITKMSTPTATPTALTKRSAGWIVVTILAAGLALAGILAAMLFAFGPAAHASSADGWEPSQSSSGGNGHHNRPNPPVAPSATIRQLQEELGQLNYYNGPATGYMNHATVQAITYLQRDAHLPETGQMNSATEHALTNMLEGGNNQMGGNTNNNVMNN